MKRFIAALIVSLTLSVQAGELTWYTDFAKAQEEAKASKKVIFIDFTGSDWCGFCKKQDKEVFKSAEFAEYANKNLVLVKADFPRSIKQSAEQKKANEALKAKFVPGFQGFPTTVVVDANGKKLGEEVGYAPGSGPQAVIEKVEKMKKK